MSVRAEALRADGGLRYFSRVLLVGVRLELLS